MQRLIYLDNHLSLAQSPVLDWNIWHQSPILDFCISSLSLFYFQVAPSHSVTNKNVRAAAHTLSVSNPRVGEGIISQPLAWCTNYKASADHWVIVNLPHLPLLGNPEGTKCSLHQWQISDFHSKSATATSLQTCCLCKTQWPTSYSLKWEADHSHSHHATHMLP